MCTIGYQKNLNILFKNRDKSDPTAEVIVPKPDYLAAKTEGANYFSLGVNKYGCGFVSAAVNTPYWTMLMEQEKFEEARVQSRQENEGLVNPMVLISGLLPGTQKAEEWIDALKGSGMRFMGYNVIIADKKKAIHLECYGSDVKVQRLDASEVITNHFKVLAHGPKAENDYPSSFERLRYGLEEIGQTGSINDVLLMLNPVEPSQRAKIWRNGVFKTVSSSLLDLDASMLYYSSGDSASYTRIARDMSTTEWQKSPVEMSRYIDLDTYHRVERTHPFYIEMIDEIEAYIRGFCSRENNKYKVLEFGAGTGLFTSVLSKFKNLELDVLEMDSNCCTILKLQTNEKPYNVICGDAVTYCMEGRYDIVVSTFAHDHIHFDKRYCFAENIRKNLKNGGIYIMGGEILPRFSSERERKKALFIYHNFIIDRALKDDYVELAEIENNALKSGLDMIGDFKRHEEMFEEEMRAGGFSQLFKKRIGPADDDNVGGVFVYVFGA